MAFLDPDSMPLREKIREAERLLRELTDHLDLSFQPKVHQVRKLTRHYDPESGMSAADVSVRRSVADVLDSEVFSSQLATELGRFLTSISVESAKALRPSVS